MNDRNIYQPKLRGQFMKASTCARNSSKVKAAEYRERKLHEAIDRRSKNGKANEDAMEKHYAGCDQNGNRIWSF